MSVRLRLLALYILAVLVAAVCLKCFVKVFSWLFHKCTLGLGQSFYESRKFDVRLINIWLNPGLSAAVLVAGL